MPAPSVDSTEGPGSLVESDSRDGDECASELGGDAICKPSSVRLSRLCNTFYEVMQNPIEDSISPVALLLRYMFTLSFLSGAEG
eukprot:3172116-Prymnesium_polylepis.1